QTRGQKVPGPLKNSLGVPSPRSRRFQPRQKCTQDATNGASGLLSRSLRGTLQLSFPSSMHAESSSMSLSGSISRLLEGLKAGDEAAAQALWKRYCDRLVRLARGKLAAKFRRVADEEDIALSAFKSLCLGGRRDRFPDLRDRDSLWGLLVFITAQKAADWV